MSQQIQPYISPQEYLRLERQSEYKSEYVNGQIFAMTGASRKHNLITTNISRELSQQLKDDRAKSYAVDNAGKSTGHRPLHLSRCCGRLRRARVRG
jgi:Uma2 family endonuclease